MPLGAFFSSRLGVEKIYLKGSCLKTQSERSQPRSGDIFIEQRSPMNPSSGGAAYSVAHKWNNKALPQKSHPAWLGTIWVRVFSWIVFVFRTKGTIHEITRTKNETRYCSNRLLRQSYVGERYVAYGVSHGNRTGNQPAPAEAKRFSKG